MKKQALLLIALISCTQVSAQAQYNNLLCVSRHKSELFGLALFGTVLSLITYKLISNLVKEPTCTMENYYSCENGSARDTHCPSYTTVPAQETVVCNYNYCPSTPTYHTSPTRPSTQVVTYESTTTNYYQPTVSYKPVVKEETVVVYHKPVPYVAPAAYVAPVQPAAQPQPTPAPTQYSKTDPRHPAYFDNFEERRADLALDY